MLDAMGTGYVVAKGEVQEQRPAPLRHAHVQAFRNRCLAYIVTRGRRRLLDVRRTSEGVNSVSVDTQILSGSFVCQMSRCYAVPVRNICMAARIGQHRTLIC